LGTTFGADTVLLVLLAVLLFLFLYVFMATKVMKMMRLNKIIYAARTIIRYNVS